MTDFDTDFDDGTIMTVPLPRRPESSAPDERNGGTVAAPSVRPRRVALPVRPAAPGRPLHALPRQLVRPAAAPRVASESSTPFGMRTSFDAAPTVEEPVEEGGRRCHLIEVTSASGRAGVSVLAGLIAMTFAKKAGNVAAATGGVGLMDASPVRGGLELVLGLEADSGLRWSNVEAPMGYLDAGSFVREVVHWEGIDVLSSDPWNGASLEGWEVEAAYSAMCSAEEWLVVDEGSAFESLPSQSSGTPVSVAVTRVTVVELSIYGLSQAMGRLMQRQAKAHDGNREMKRAVNEVFIGVPSMRPCGKGRMLVSLEQAAAYLGVDFLGVLTPFPRIERDISRGLGIKEIPQRYERLLNAIVRRADGGDDDA